MKKNIYFLLVCLVLLASKWTYASTDTFVDSAHYEDGEKIPYLLTTASTQAPNYVLVLMPGGNGQMHIQMNPDGSIYFQGGGNFLIRSRSIFADNEFATVSLDADRSAKRMLAVIADIHSKFPVAKIYIVGTSNGTFATMSLSKNIDGQVAGFIHTSSRSSISDLDTRNSKSRNLIVTHKFDGCRNTSPSASIENHSIYGTDLIIVEGGIDVGDPCLAMAHHGYNGIEVETIQKIKDWIKIGPKK